MLVIRATRREFLATSASLALSAAAFSDEPKAPAIAAIVTEFRPNSHAEVIVGRWLEGFELDGKNATPRSQVVSLFTDQVPRNDISRELAKKHRIPIYKTIKDALCRGGDKLAVDGVLLIGEHGDYLSNEKGQKLYPRRRFFEETVKVFRDAGKSVPVYSDKHLSYSWENARWMYDQARELKAPFMAGSSVPLVWRKPAAEIEAGSDVEEIVVVGYGGLESYGFHALEALQCLMERRKGGETGVAAVTCLEGKAVWNAAGTQWSRDLLDAALAVALDIKKGKPEENCKNPAAFLLEYKDGRRGTVLMLNGHARETLAAWRIKGREQPGAVHFWLQPVRPFGHFTMLVQAIDQMFCTGKPPYPVERTLLTTGVLDAAMTSKMEKNKRLATPQLAIAYTPGPAWRQPGGSKTGPQPPG